MEEADILGDRVAIMAAGQLQALGTSLHLKNLFGGGKSLTQLQIYVNFILHDLQPDPLPVGKFTS